MQPQMMPPRANALFGLNLRKFCTYPRDMLWERLYRSGKGELESVKRDRTHCETGRLGFARCKFVEFRPKVRKTLHLGYAHLRGTVLSRFRAVGSVGLANCLDAL